MMNELKIKLVALTKLEEIANKAEEEMMNDCENEEKENAFDVAYQNEFNAFMEASQMVVDMTSGQIDINTARAMVRGKRAELLSILEKAV